MSGAAGYAKRWLPFLVYLGAIFWVSHQTRLPAGVGRWDKLLHAVEYAAAAALAIRAIHGSLRDVPAGIVASGAALAIVYGLLDELHQSFVPGRSSTWGDALADAVGATLAAVAVLAFDRWRRRGTL